VPGPWKGPAPYENGGYLQRKPQKHHVFSIQSPGIPDRGLNIALHFVWATDPYVNFVCLVLDGSWRLY